MPETPQNISAWIARLASADADEREQAAREIFRQGAAAAEPLLAKWFADREFRSLARVGNTLLTVGVAVHPERFAAIRAACGLPRLAEVPPDQDALEFSLGFRHAVRLDVLTPRAPAGEGAIARFLERFGEGIQQVECDVRDVEQATRVLRTRFALEPVYPETRAGADGTCVNFFLVSSAQDRKILIELVEVADPKKKGNAPRG